MHIDWDDVQTLEALVRTGNVEAAGRALGIGHTSISRRVAALETQLGTLLFARGPRLVPTELARTIAQRASAMREVATGIEALVDAERRRRDGRLVVTTSDVLSPLLCAALAEAELAEQVELVLGDEELELVPGAVDLALRPSPSPRGALRGRSLGRLRVGLFRGPGRVERWLQPSTTLRAKASMRWWRHVPRDEGAGVVCGSLLAMRDACAAGLGRAALPCFLGLGDARLRLEREIDGGPPLWLLAPAGAAGRTRSHARAALASALRGVHGAFVG